VTAHAGDIARAIKETWCTLKLLVGWVRIRAVRQIAICRCDACAYVDDVQECETVTRHHEKALQDRAAVLKIERKERAQEMFSGMSMFYTLDEYCLILADYCLSSVHRIKLPSPFFRDCRG